MKVLLIEDDAGISRPVEEGLTREGHEVTLAATCEAARGAAFNGAQWSWLRSAWKPEHNRSSASMASWASA